MPKNIIHPYEFGRKFVEKTLNKYQGMETSELIDRVDEYKHFAYKAQNPFHLGKAARLWEYVLARAVS